MLFRIVEAMVFEQTGNSLIEDVIRYSLTLHVYYLCEEDSENVFNVSTQLETQYFRTHIPCGVLTKGREPDRVGPRGRGQADSLSTGGSGPAAHSHFLGQKLAFEH